MQRFCFCFDAPFSFNVDFSTVGKCEGFLIYLFFLPINSTLYFNYVLINVSSLQTRQLISMTWAWTGKDLLWEWRNPRNESWENGRRNTKRTQGTFQRSKSFRLWVTRSNHSSFCERWPQVKVLWVKDIHYWGGEGRGILGSWRACNKVGLTYTFIQSILP